MKQKITLLLAIFVSFFIVFGLSKTILGTYQSGKWLKVLEKEVKGLLDKNLQLRRTLEYSQSDEFIEKQAREKLNLVKPGETLVVIEENRQSAIGNRQSEEIKETASLSNPQKWQYLFFDTR